MMRILLALTVALVAAAPAQATDPSIEDGSAQAALDQARARFAAAGVSDYGYKLRITCFCPPAGNPYTVHVRSGKPVSTPKAIESYDTVPELFDRIQSAIDNGSARLDATYGDDGVPASVYVDSIEYAADDEYGYTVTEFAEEDPTIPEEIDDSIEDGSAQAALADARARWKAAGIRSYKMRVRRLCFCPRRYTRGRTVKIVAGRIRRAPKVIRRYATVYRLFGVVETAIRSGYSGLDVTYAKTGRPKRISLDPNNLMVDEESTITATRFKRLGR